MVWRLSLLLLAIGFSGCRKEKKAEPENLNPYHDVMPQKVKQQVEQIQRQEDERNERKAEEAR